MPIRPFAPYIALWISLTGIAIAVAFRHRRTLGLLSPEYRRFLREPWKIATFLVAWSAFVFLAPLTGDPTWDWVDGSLMSLLCFWTAPWSVGILVRLLPSVRGVGARPSGAEVYVALIAWLFTASWSYDGYLCLRDGMYPATWSVNIVASTILYTLGGLYWNAAVHPKRGLVFAFMVPEWPATPRTEKLGRLALILTCIKLPVAGGTLWYVYDYVVRGGNWPG